MPGKHNSSLAEQENAKWRVLERILPHSAQDTAEDVMKMVTKHHNEKRIVANVAERELTQRPTNIRPTFVVDALNLTRVAKLTFYQRDHLEAGTQKMRFANPNKLITRKMLSHKIHTTALSLLISRQKDNKNEFEWVSGTSLKTRGSKGKVVPVEVSAFLNWIQHHRSPLFKFLDAHISTKTEDDITWYQLDSRLMAIIDLLDHWTRPNHESHLISPHVAEQLVPFCEHPVDGKYKYTSEHLSGLEQIANSLVLSLVYFGTETDKTSTDTGQASKWLSEVCVNLLTLMLQLAENDRATEVSNCNIRSPLFPRMTQIGGWTLPKKLDIPYLVSHQAA